MVLPIVNRSRALDFFELYLGKTTFRQKSHLRTHFDHRNVMKLLYKFTECLNLETRIKGMLRSHAPSLLKEIFEELDLKHLI